MKIALRVSTQPRHYSGRRREEVRLIAGRLEAVASASLTAIFPSARVVSEPPRSSQHRPITLDIQFDLNDAVEFLVDHGADSLSCMWFAEHHPFRTRHYSCSSTDEGSGDQAWIDASMSTNQASELACYGLYTEFNDYITRRPCASPECMRHSELDSVTIKYVCCPDSFTCADRIMEYARNIALKRVRQFVRVATEDWISTCL